MMPVWVSLGDYDSVLAARALCTKASASTEPSLFGPDPELKDDDGSGGEDGGGSGVPRRYVVDSDDEDNWDYDRAMLHYPLLQHACGGVSDSAEEAAATAAAATAAAQQQFGADALLRFVTAYDEYQGAGGDVPWGVRLPGARDAPEERNAALPPGALFHLDSGGQACFTEAEAERAAAHLYKMDFVRAVQAQVNNLSFQLPQACDRCSTAPADDHLRCHRHRSSSRADMRKAAAARAAAAALLPVRSSWGESRRS